MLSQNESNPKLLKKPIALSNLFWVIIVLILLAGNVYIGAKCFNLRNKNSVADAVLEKQKINEKVLNFTRLFISSVLKAEGEIAFETRLKLESTVRELNDEEILNKWQEFVNSKTEIEAQENVKNLLEVLVNKIESS